MSLMPLDVPKGAHGFKQYWPLVVQKARKSGG